jgi:hypothetical protein
MRAVHVKLLVLSKDFAFLYSYLALQRLVNQHKTTAAYTLYNQLRITTTQIGVHVNDSFFSAMSMSNLIANATTTEIGLQKLWTGGQSWDGENVNPVWSGGQREKMEWWAPIVLSKRLSIGAWP